MHRQAKIPTVDEATLVQLIAWSRGYLDRKRTEPSTRDSEFALDLWSGMLCALQELRELRRELEYIKLKAQADCL